MIGKLSFSDNIAFDDGREFAQFIDDLPSAFLCNKSNNVIVLLQLRKLTEHVDLLP